MVYNYMEALIELAEDTINIFSLKDTNLFNKDTFHLDYRDGIYRQNDLAKLIRDAVPYFALTKNEYKSFINEYNTIDLQRDAWSRISKAMKEKKGDYGELLLFLLLCTYYGTEKFVTKVRLRTSVRKQILGFDCAHFTIENNEPVLWLGEAKFHQSLSTAISGSLDSIKEHCTTKYMEDEFSILKPNIEINSGRDFKLLRRVLRNKNINKIKIKIPILLTYDSNSIKNNSSINKPFKDDLKKELQNNFKKMNSKYSAINCPFELLFFLFPFLSVKKIKENLNKIESANR